MDYLPEIEDGLRLIPEAASTQAAEVDALYWALLAVSGVLVLVLAALLVYFGLKYRAGSPSSRQGRASRHARSHHLELAFAGVLLVVFSVLFWWASRLYLDIHRTPAASMTVNVIGEQWMWKAQHPSGAREINTLHVPVGEPIRLRIAAEDVIHSFFVPAFRIKRDAIPGTYTYAWFEATAEGEYSLFCAEYCGTDHSRMRGKVVAMSPEDYEQWLGENGGGRDLAAQGEQLFRSYGCDDCHLSVPTEQAPALAGAFGREVHLADGTRVTADERYLRDSILRPRKHVVAGYEASMPTFEGQIRADEILEIIAYIQSLEPRDEPRASLEPGVGR